MQRFERWRQKAAGAPFQGPHFGLSPHPKSKVQSHVHCFCWLNSPVHLHHQYNKTYICPQYFPLFIYSAKSFKYGSIHCNKFFFMGMWTYQIQIQKAHIKIKINIWKLFVWFVPTLFFENCMGVCFGFFLGISLWWTKSLCVACRDDEKNCFNWIRLAYILCTYIHILLIKCFYCELF